VIVNKSLTMNYLKTTIVAVSIIATLALVSIAGFQLNEIVAEETSEKKGYTFAENTKITAVFSFNDGTEIADFEVFEQKLGFDLKQTAVFELERIVGNTPLLHKVSDMAHKYSLSSFNDGYNDFDVTILLAQEGNVIRQYNYASCDITNNIVKTLHDKEEGWNTSKGFAVIDKYEFTCSGYTPYSPVYEEMTNNGKKSTTVSSTNMEEPKEFWYDNIKYKNYPFGN